MKKIFLSIFTVTTLLFSAKAQDKEVASLQLGVGPNVALPLGDFGDISTFGIGAEFQAELKVA